MEHISSGVFILAVCPLLLPTSARSIAEPRDDRFAYEHSLLEKLVILEQESAGLKQRIEQLEKTSSPAKVIAEAWLSKDIDVGSNPRIMYDVEVSNVGGGFDFDNGEFTAPVNGTYLVFVQMCVPSATWMNLDLFKNGAVVGRVFSGDDAYHSCGSSAMVLELTSGNKLWVARESGSATVLSDGGHGKNAFTAVLIR